MMSRSEDVEVITTRCSADAEDEQCGKHLRRAFGDLGSQFIVCDGSLLVNSYGIAILFILRMFVG